MMTDTTNAATLPAREPRPVASEAPGRATGPALAPPTGHDVNGEWEVRRILAADLPACAALGQWFFEEQALPLRFEADVWIETWHRLFAAGSGVGWGLRHNRKWQGVFGALLYRDPLDGLLVASEAFWWMRPAARGRGLKLLETFEQWAQQQGVERLLVTHLLRPLRTLNSNSRLGRVYTRRGYRPVETTYEKGIICQWQ